MTPPAYSAILVAPFGALGVQVAGEVLTGVCYLPPGTPPQAPGERFVREVCAQLDAYLRDPRFVFQLALRPAGTAFQHRVWQAIAAIPPGRVRRYGEIATELGSAARAVGQACGANPLPLVVPCHRVVAAAGLGGFAHARGGFLLDTKRWLLAHEGILP